MHGAVPGDVDETHEPVALARADPAEAVPLHLPTPVVAEEGVIEPFGMQRVHLGAGELATPLVTRRLGRHAPLCTNR